MNIIVGNMWETWGETDLFIVTGNSTINAKGAVVMGRGIAKQLRDSVLGIDKSFARGMTSEYGLIVRKDIYHEELGKTQKEVGLFQVKNYWGDKAQLHLIHRSLYKLFSYMVKNQIKRIDMNFPGVGNGGLDPNEVLPIIEYLPDCVNVWCDEKTIRRLKI